MPLYFRQSFYFSLTSEALLCYTEAVSFLYGAAMDKKTTTKTSSPKTTAKTGPKKTTPKATRNVVTKATNSVEPTVTSQEDYELNIDKAVFEEGGEEVAVPAMVTHAPTIDGTLLSKEQRSFKRRFKTKSTADFSLAERYDPDVKFGLSKAQVDMRMEQGYFNYTHKKSGKTYKSIFISNIFTFLNVLTFLVAAALIAVGAEFSQLFFMIIIVANIAIGIFQEIRSKRTVDKLSLITAPTALVMRDGEKKSVPVEEVVLDDVMCLEMGKQICADCVVLRGECEVNESMLTGESVPVKKKVGSVLYSGSFVSSGSVFARVDKVGSANYVETLTSYAKKYRKPKSELNSSIRLFIKIISLIIVPLAVIMLVVYNKQTPAGPDKWREIISSISGSVIGMIPAGMFLLTTVALAVSVIRLAKRKTLVQDIYCIEMLARVDVLCLDKTGTITDGSMQVNNIIELKGGETEFNLTEVIGSMLTATEDNNQTAMALANRFGYSQNLKPVKVLPFSSQRKLSAVTFEGAGTYMLGAPEFVLKDLGVRIEKLIAENAANGFRVLVLAHSPAEIQGEKLPAVRRPLCLIVIEDHIREDAVETIRWFKENNVAVKVISGDNPITVSEVARRVGVNNADLYISLEGLSNQEVIEAANKYTVFGRVSPEQKCLLVKSLKAKGHTVAMTGDGVNDILAMREADCSVAIASGAEAARNVSHLVLLDSNFTSMPDVVMEGRRVVNNIQKSSSLFLMKTFMSIVLTIIFLVLTITSGVKYPFDTSNLLLLEWFVIAIPSFALALQPNKNIIKGKFLSNVISRCIPGGLTLCISVMAVFMYSYFMNGNVIVSRSMPGWDAYICMSVLAMTFSGMMILLKICEPLDAFRSVLMIVTSLICILAAALMPSNFFGITRLGLTDMFFVIITVLVSYFIVAMCMKLVNAIRIFN